ncbi:MAG: class I SAM-dependent methyltransferase, partial [Anaerolineales bacterium]|nr:class I SAM-dependent methyltransferase [Anaerolineales bacterium]
PVCDYEGSDYRTRFWENQNRNYEDLVERVALRRLMPAHGRTLIEIGAGFGRLAAEYTGYDRVVLFDYSRSLLREAQAKWGDDERFIYVAGDWYKMPFVAGLFDTMVQIRTIHHAADVPALFTQLRRIARPNGDYILEFANKRNLKAMLRHALGRQNWSPYALDPIEFAELNFDFHPRWIQEQLRQHEFAPGRVLTVSHFRIATLKRLVPTSLLVQLDSLAQLTGNWWQVTPSVFIHNKVSPSGKVAQDDTFFVCPEDQTPLPITSSNGILRCLTCGRGWPAEKGFYDFKESV